MQRFAVWFGGSVLSTLPDFYKARVRSYLFPSSRILICDDLNALRWLLRANLSLESLHRFIPAVGAHEGGVRGVRAEYLPHQRGVPGDLREEAKGTDDSGKQPRNFNAQHLV